jgi:hydroxymethylglutaryl-CoA lyase
MGLANALAAVRAGVVHLDASLGGLGGCPFAPGANCNICAEDLVHMFEAMAITTGVDIAGLLRAAASLPGLLDRDVSSHLLQAGPSARRYAVPD